MTGREYPFERTDSNHAAFQNETTSAVLCPKTSILFILIKHPSLFILGVLLLMSDLDEFKEKEVTN